MSISNVKIIKRWIEKEICSPLTKYSEIQNSKWIEWSKTGSSVIASRQQAFSFIDRQTVVFIVKMGRYNTYSVTFGTIDDGLRAPSFPSLYYCVLLFPDSYTRLGSARSITGTAQCSSPWIIWPRAKRCKGGNFLICIYTFWSDHFWNEHSRPKSSLFAAEVTRTCNLSCIFVRYNWPSTTSIDFFDI